MSTVTPCLWFDNNAEEAITFYASVFKDAKVGDLNRMPNGQVITGTVEVGGQTLMVLNGGPDFKFTEAISLFVDCKDQDEVDYYWNALTADGGQEGMCGWLKDKYGLSWQIVPKALGELLGDQDSAKAGRAMQAMLQMHKIEVSELQRAHDGEYI